MSDHEHYGPEARMNEGADRSQLPRGEASRHQDGALPLFGVPDASTQLLLAERDRLRAVVAAARMFIAAQVDADSTPEEDLAAWNAMVDAFHQLDVSADMGRHVTATGKVLADADIEALADEAERGYDVSDLVPGLRRVRDAGESWHCRCGTEYDRGYFVCPDCGTARERTPGSADMGDESTEGAPHESDGDEQTSAHGAPDPPNGGPVPPSTPAPRPGAAIYGWGVWHSEDEKWIGFGVTNGIAAELIPDDPGYEHLSLRPAVVQIDGSPARRP